MIKKIGMFNIFLVLTLMIIWGVVLFLNMNSNIKLQNYTKVGISQYLGKSLPLKNSDISIVFNDNRVETILLDGPNRFRYRPEK